MRKSGILLHISSLPSPYGIGSMGKEAYDFIDFLARAGQRVWQVLPVGHTSYGDSPYQSYSSYAGNPYFIDLDALCEKGWIDKKDLKNVLREKGIDRVDYGYLYETRYPILKKAAERFLKNPTGDYYTFLAENTFWIEDYASFMALKEMMESKGREEWNKDFRVKNEKCDLLISDKDKSIFKVIQYFFFAQWNALKAYANENGIEIMGDLPIYCASDSCDVWSNEKVFLLDENYKPYLVAGVPPDGFSPKGQRWGNPLYDWGYLEETDYKWWVERLSFALKMFDRVRIDHFRGFDSYFAIDANEDTAVNGRWIDGPKMKLFDAFERNIGENLPIVAEDLGYLTESVKKLLADTGYPGMKVLQFAFDEREEGDYLPHNYTENSVCYVGTHDNNTAKGWYAEVDEKDRIKATEYFNLTEKEGIAKGLIRGAMSSVSDLCIICMQDVLELGSEARMNTPSTQCGNWQWRMAKDVLTEKPAEDLYKMTKMYGR